ncbi:Detected protein of confused Function [Hibiscus syriacus]|uniref:Detected protein of confused Function n=1 Tax=Hibiscus syriacus TaxID=106335 RepID=A0A6A2Y4V4_HIBSY|nr:Detected protein of confused Function [Hibiscus syriacus]
MLNNLNGLVSLDPVLHLTAGPVIRIKSPISNFTHMLHSRYKSKEDLNAYGVHPDHQRVNEAEGEILGELKGISGVQQITCGENFSERAKGFSLASVAVFDGVEEMEAAVGNEEYVNLQKQNVGDNLDGAIVVDYVVPTASS